MTCSMMTTKKMTTNSKKYLILLLLFFSHAAAQTTAISDTTKAFKLEIPKEVLDYQLNQMFFSNEMYSLPLYTAFIDDTSSVWIRTRMQLGSFHEQNSSNQLQFSILNPLYQNYAKSQSMKTWKMILGSVQAGAVGYLAYKHLKKYGFLKKK